MEILTLKSFTTHDGHRASGLELKRALKAYAKEIRDMAYRIRAEDAYADHVSELIKDDALSQDLRRADAVESGLVVEGQLNTASARQSLNTILTGKCIALLPVQG